MTVKRLLLAGGALLASASAASASGFQVYLPGHKSNGMGGVGVGLSLDQSAMFLNPGALAMVRANGVVLGANATFARVAFRSENGGPQRDLQPTVTTPFNFYASFGPKDGKFKAGIAVYTPAGSKLVYADGWEGRAALTQIDLKSVFVQPTLSYAITPQLSVGAGLTILALGSVNLQRDISALPYPGATIELDGKTKTQFGVNAGIMFKPSEKLSVGISYTSKVNAMVEDGTVTVKGLPDATPGSPSYSASRRINPGFTATNFAASLPIPAHAAIGIGLMPTEKLTIGLDVVWTQWSAYRELRFDFSGNNGNGDYAAVGTPGQPGSFPASTGTPGLVGGNNTSISKRNYQDVLAFRLGAQYKVTEALTVRGGVVYDQSPVRDGYVTPETPDNDRLALTTGLSYDVSEKFGIDASYQFIQILKRTQTQSQLLDNGTTDRVAGTYNSFIHVPGVGVHYNF
ncbi:outer membrane protein transport protein [Hymenobacter glaciei]|uniref:Outer membrane protein transport protein n=1 Tax=Hymenobacter glaciei TaxID=877209 RepID=A0ABP7U9U5_9BACT